MTTTGEHCSVGYCVEGRTAVVGSGSLVASILLVGEAPGVAEVREGAPFVGRAGKLLDSILVTAGLTRRDLYITNTCACVALEREDRRPLPSQMTACRPRLMAEITTVDPAVIVLMGVTALDAFYPGTRIGDVYGVWRYSNGRIVIPTYHPAHVLRGNPQVQPIIEAAFIAARRLTQGVTDGT